MAATPRGIPAAGRSPSLSTSVRRVVPNKESSRRAKSSRRRRFGKLAWPQAGTRSVFFTVAARLPELLCSVRPLSDVMEETRGRPGWRRGGDVGTAPTYLTGLQWHAGNGSSLRRF